MGAMSMAPVDCIWVQLRNTDKQSVAVFVSNEAPFSHSGGWNTSNFLFLIKMARLHNLDKILGQRLKH